MPRFFVLISQIDLLCLAVVLFIIDTLALFVESLFESCVLGRRQLAAIFGAIDLCIGCDIGFMHLEVLRFAACKLAAFDPLVDPALLAQETVMHAHRMFFRHYTLCRSRWKRCRLSLGKNIAAYKHCAN